MLASVVHLLWFLRYLLKSLPIVLGFNSALHPLAALLSSPGGLWLGRKYVNSLIVIITLAVSSRELLVILPAQSTPCCCYLFRFHCYSRIACRPLNLMSLPLVQPLCSPGTSGILSWTE